MPTIDMPTQQSSGGSKEGFGTGLPTPILLAAIGGGIGLVVFLSRKSGSNTGTGADKNTLLPNTAIMLGSLQQGVLDLQGQVSMGNADLSSQLTGVGENLGTQIDAQSAQWQQAFAALNTYLGGNFENLASSETSLSTAIAGLGTQNAGLADSLTTILNQLYGVNSGLSQVSSGITGLSGQVQANSGGIGTIANGINSILNGQNQLQGSVNSLGQQISQLPLNQFADGTFVKAWDPVQHIYGIGVVKGGVLNKFQTWSQYISAGGSGSMADLNSMPTIAIGTYNAEGTVYTGH